MLFSKLYTAACALSSLATASPLTHNPSLAARDASPKPGIFWTQNLQTRSQSPRKDIVLAQPVGSQRNQVQIGRDNQLAIVIETEIQVENLDSVKDNVRRNHYRNRNRRRGRNDVNTIIIVVIVVVDNRDRSNRNLRYVTRQVEANPGAPQREWVVVTEQKTMTVDNSNPTAGLGPTATGAPVPEATGAGAPRLGVYDPNAPLQLDSEQSLLPAGIEAPRYDNRGARKDQDPAIIIIAEQVVFVVFDVNDRGGRNRNGTKNDDGKKNDNKKGDNKNDNQNKDNQNNDDKKDNSKDGKS